MKLCCCAILLCIVAARTQAQNLTAQSLVPGAWELEPFVGGGTGIGHSDSTQFVVVGARLGIVLSNDHLDGLMRGDFEFGVAVMPVYLVAQPGGTLYGWSFKPVIFQWNFTSKHKVTPYAQLAGGVLFTTSNVPPGNTSNVNFTPQLGLGFRFFSRPKRSWDFEIQAVHHSNASLGAANPGLNVSLMFSLGYSWFK
jgi:lipid A 3-O-deacylase